MRLHRLLIFFLTTFIGFAQNNNLNPALPPIISSSPEASSLGQYGGIPIDISSGQLNYSIPIYTIKVGDFEYPLTLSYNYSGFRPEADPTMVGLGWTANFNGAIIRQLKGIADEGITGYFAKGDFYKNISSYNLDTKKDILINGANGFWDTRPDKYIINTPTLSGSFRFKTNRTPVFSQPKNYLITSDPILQYINLVDDKGVLYEFNEKEKTTIWSFNTNPEESEYTSSWMLKKVKLPNSNQELNFQYQDYNINHGYQSFIKTVKDYGSYKDENGGFRTQPSDDNIMGKVIKRIDFPNGYILFNQTISSYRTPGAYGSFISTQQVRLQSVTVYNLKNEAIERFIFDYYNTGYYYYLKSIKKQSPNNTLLNYYDFEYADLDQMPADRITNDKVDLWGFYNGEPFNQSNLASLNASFNKSKIGALTKITYPTKGTTEIVYEANNLGEEGSEPVLPTRDPDVLIISSEDTYGCESKEKLITITDNIDYAKITLETDVTALDSWAQSAFKSSTPNGISYSLTSARGSSDYTNTNRYTRQEYFVTLYPGTYRLIGDLCEAGNNPGTHYAKVTVDHNVSLPPPVGGTVSGDVGGIRVKQTKDCSNNNNNCILKIYKYPDGGFLTEPKPRFRSFEVEVADGLVSNPALMNYKRYTESYYPMTPMTILGSHVAYPTVEIITTDESIGKTVNNFSYYFPVIPQYNYNATLSYNIPRDPAIIFPQPKLLDFPELTEDNVKNVKLSKQSILEKTADGFKEKQIETNSYTDKAYNDSNSVFDCVVLRYPYELISTTGAYNDYTCPPHLQPLFHKTKDYPLTSTNIAKKESNGEILTQTSYLYDPETSYPLEVKTLNSIGNEIIDKTYYPKNKTSLNGLTESQQSAIEALINRNIVSVPIQTEKIINTSSGSSIVNNITRTNFSVWQNGTIVLPEFIQTAKGSNTLEDRIQFHDYYQDGKLKEVSQKNGVHTVYIWGYSQTLPIAKIENATNAQVASALGVSDLYSINETNLAAINALRNALPNAMVTTYTYIPLVGISTITDPKGDTATYTYDSFGRLESVRDGKGFILSENQYNYKQ